MTGKFCIAAAAALLAIGAVRAERAPYARFEDGFLSATRPSGWLECALKTQASGLTGHPEAMSYPYDSCLWAGKIQRMGTHGIGWWRYEQTAYYPDGLVRLGYATGDKALISKGESGVDWTLEHATPEGFLGDPCLWDKKHHRIEHGYEMWPLAVFFRAMKAKYDATRDARIPAALAKYFKLYDAKTIAVGRNTINVEGMVWAYVRTGDKRLIELAEEAWRGKKERIDWSGDLTPANCSDDKPIYMHGASYAEELKIPTMLYAATGNKEYLHQAVNAERKLERDHMLPDGCPSSTEQTRGNSVYWGHETCTVSDYTWALGYLLEVTGDAGYADKMERCVFNAAFGAARGDFRSLQYFSNLNQFIVTARSNDNTCYPGRPWAQYRPTHETECCVGQITRIVPNFVSRMWMRDAAQAPVAALYAPSSVDFGWARIEEETNYPFDGKVTFRFRVKEPRETSFTYRVPGWCKTGATVKVCGGEASPAGEPGTFVSVKRTFRDGDTVELDFPMKPVFEVLPRRHYVIRDFVNHWAGKIEGRSCSQGTVVVRGPLLYAYRIPETRKADDVDYPEMRGKKSANPEFKSWDIRPAGPFNYALASHEAEVVETGAPVGDWMGDATSPVEIKVKARRIKWELGDGGRCTPDLPEKPEPLPGETETLTLTPYGAADLRLAVFPDLSAASER
ncbi:MAG: glycoside hydrolase family 127 protein [Kiritimatiellae bacterium]|nr:glycoside hydrolase family 127 protein [Kiritimatiellia bacterium]